MAKLKLNEEFRKYSPPRKDILLPPPVDEYDEVGFDRNAKINFNYKEGFSYTFVSTNIVQDFGFIHAAKTEPTLIRPFDKIYIHFDKSVDVKAGDDFLFINLRGRSLMRFQIEMVTVTQSLHRFRRRKVKKPLGM